MRKNLIRRIAEELDWPSVFMNGPRQSSLRKAEAILDLIADELRNPDA